VIGPVNGQERSRVHLDEESELRAASLGQRPVTRRGGGASRAMMADGDAITALSPTVKFYTASLTLRLDDRENVAA
jgi:hypothetical protein